MNGMLKAGLYRRVITPPVMGPVVGGFEVSKAEDILDEFYIQALVLDDGKKEVAVVSVDIIGVPGKIVREMASSIETLCGIPASHVIIHAVHNHTGVELMEEGADPYTGFFKDSVVSAVYLAQKRKQPVRIGVGRDINRKYVFNRRLKKPDGSIVMNWVDREFVQDCDGSGVVGPEMIVLKIEDERKNPLGFLINYSNHNNSLGGNVRSSDISGYLGEILRRVYGQHIVILYLLGACGNTNWIDYRDYSQLSNPRLYQRIATGLAGTALGIIAEMEYPEIHDLDMAEETLHIAERPFCEEDDKVDLTFGPPGREDTDAAFRHFKTAREKGRDQELGVFDLDIHTLRLGKGIAIATNPCELFTDFGLEIKKKSPFQYTLIAELTNGSCGYVPTAYAYEEGGYETRKPASRMEKDAGDRIVRSSLELLNRIHPG